MYATFQVTLFPFTLISMMNLKLNSAQNTHEIDSITGSASLLFIIFFPSQLLIIRTIKKVRERRIEKLKF